MATAHGQATVAGNVVLRAYNPRRKSILIQNLGTGVLWVGATGVTAADGLSCAAGATMVLDRGGDIVVVTATGTCDVRFLEETSSYND